MKRFLSDETGATAIEYAMIAGFLSVFIVGAVDLLGQNVYTSFFAKIANAVSNP